MATHSPPRAPPSDATYTLYYNSYGPSKPSPSSSYSSPGAPQPRLTSHPFLVDQTPYLSTSRRLSGMSFQSTSSASTGTTYRSASGSSPSSVASSASASTVSLAPSWPFRSASNKPALAPAVSITSSPPSDKRRGRHCRAASTSYASTSSPGHSSPKAASLHTATAPIDRRCLQWMREAEQQEWIMGSVASRSSPRGVRREAISDVIDETPAGSVEVLYEHEREYAHQIPPRPDSALSKCSAVKRRFRLNSA